MTKYADKRNTQALDLERQLAERNKQVMDAAENAQHYSNLYANALRVVAQRDRDIAMLIDVLETYAAEWSAHWKQGMPILEPISDAAIAAIRAHGIKE